MQTNSDVIMTLHWAHGKVCMS